jgi:hypothetical protein
MIERSTTTVEIHEKDRRDREISMEDGGPRRKPRVWWPGCARSGEGSDNGAATTKGKKLRERSF